MRKVFNNPAELEKVSKEKFSIPPFLMMENAARSMAEFIINKNPKSLFILCGKGNNGGDGLALSRLLEDKCDVTVICPEIPTATEAQVQYEICQKLGIKIIKDFDWEKLKGQLSKPISETIIVDCLYGIGFHGELKSEIKEILDKINQIDCLKIACDLPSALYFRADYTITMGQEKTVLCSDVAKAVCGKIIVADLGISRQKFEENLPCDAYLIEENDAKLPFRKNPAANKGTYGHTCVFAGEKAGAAIISATAAMKFGSGLTTLVKTPGTNLEQFKISPELMIAEKIPEKTTAVVLGPGFSGKNFGEIEGDGAGKSVCRGVDDGKSVLQTLLSWFSTAKNPALVLDAGIFSYEKICLLLEKLNKIENARIILTPHLLECSRLFAKIKENYPSVDFSDSDIQVKNLAQLAEAKIKLGKIFNQIYPKTTLVMKSANTFIASQGEIFICRDGGQSLAKGGSGDVLAGLCGSLLAQGYSAKDAAITAVEAHALASQKIGEQAYDLTPEGLIGTFR